MAVSSSGEQFFFTRERVLTFLLAGATLLGLYVCYLIAKPFIAPIAFALALAVATQRPYEWLRSRLPNDVVAAVLAIVLVTLLIVSPAILLGTYLVQQAAENLAELQSGDTISRWRSALESHPEIGSFIVWAESRLELEG